MLLRSVTHVFQSDTADCQSEEMQTPDTVQAWDAGDWRWPQDRDVGRFALTYFTSDEQVIGVCGISCGSYIESAAVIRTKLQR